MPYKLATTFQGKSQHGLIMFFTFINHETDPAKYEIVTHSTPSVDPALRRISELNKLEADEQAKPINYFYGRGYFNYFENDDGLTNKVYKFPIFAKDSKGIVEIVETICALTLSEAEKNVQLRVSELNALRALTKPPTISEMLQAEDEANERRATELKTAYERSEDELSKRMGISTPEQLEAHSKFINEALESKPTTPTPALGRIVIYKDHLGHKFPAIITKVNYSTNLDLTVFTIESPLHAWGILKGTEPNTWHWPERT